MAPEMEKSSFTSLEQQQTTKSMSNVPTMATIKPPEIIRSLFITSQLTLRLFSVVSTLISISLMVTAHQTITIFTVQFKPHYSYSSAYRFLVGANSVICAFSAISSMFVYLLRRSELRNNSNNKSDSQLINKYYFLFLHDVVMLVLVVSGCSAATAIGYVGKHGEEDMTWQAVCDEVPKFCDRMFIGSVFSYFGFFAYFVLTLISARRLITSIPAATTPQ